MDATTMPSIVSLINKLEKDYPDLNFVKDANFSWSNSDKTIYYDDKSKDCQVYLLHELAHSTLGHSDYKFDIELVAMESRAWDEMKNIADKYQIKVGESIVQSNLDTYRDWLHKRSTCPNCKATGIQIETNKYSCLACSVTWRVNEARLCALKRYKI